MTPHDLRILCTALGFTVVVMQDGKISKKDGALRATALANLIEKFCRTSIPEAFTGENENMQVVDLVTSNPEKKFSTAENIATAIVEVMKEKGGCLPQDIIAKGFTSEEVDRHWAMAKALAHVELKIMDS